MELCLKLSCSAYAGADIEEWKELNNRIYYFVEDPILNNRIYYFVEGPIIYIYIYISWPQQCRQWKMLWLFVCFCFVCFVFAITLSWMLIQSLYQELAQAAPSILILGAPCCLCCMSFMHSYVPEVLCSWSCGLAELCHFYIHRALCSRSSIYPRSYMFPELSLRWPTSMFLELYIPEVLCFLELCLFYISSRSPMFLGNNSPKILFSKVLSVLWIRSFRSFMF